MTQKGEHAEAEKRRRLRSFGHHEHRQDRAAPDPAQEGYPARGHALPPQEERGERQNGDDGVRFGNGQFLQQQRTEHKRHGREQRGGQACMALRRALHQKRRDQDRDHGREPRRPFVDPAGEECEAGDQPAQQRRLFVPPDSVDVRFKKMSVRQHVAGDFRVGAFLVDERAHGQIGQHAACPQQNNKNRDDAGAREKILELSRPTADPLVERPVAGDYRHCFPCRRA